MSLRITNYFGLLLPDLVQRPSRLDPAKSDQEYMPLPRDHGVGADP